ncbi:hypothetical protein [Tunicatimonas pelagia]|uniref:hypothetical protein n=1 Tax=Tunicatimonas pelagia TaxID=931531 RepID=UPI002666273C|nr:hypothetical protein [Tunicatimonas pelagia]WKN45265.1 hypothetical protein P0M28_09875 [Tunicatimonas pelagia]
MTRTFYFLVVLILSLSQSYAKVIRVDNNEGASADYIKLQNAINNADPGDSIYVVGSPNYYDTNTQGRLVEIRLNKEVIIIGPGYFLGENNNTQFNKQTAKVYQINIGEGADNSILTGLDFNASSSSYININRERLDGSQGNNSPNNITITRNIIDELYIYHASNTLVERNYISTNVNPIFLDETSSRSVIRNNILRSGNRYATIYGDFQGVLSNTVISNNTLTNGLYRIRGATIQNNIFITGGFNDCDDNNVKNNIFTTVEDAVFPENSTANDAENNIFGAVQANLFIAPTPSLDRDFQLADQSPARGIGIDGVDAGAFGGTSPYKISGLPGIPAIYDLTTSGIGTPTDGMSVTIKARSHN